MREERARETPSRRTLTLIVAPIVGLVIAGMVGNALHPTLVNEHPLLLLALEPRLRYLILVAEKVDFAPFLIVATLRRLASDPLFYLLGYLYGDAGVRWIEGRMGEGGGVIRAFERGFAKAAPVMVFLLPGSIVCVLAGATGMSIPVFLALNLLGTLTVVTLTHEFASVVAGPIGVINRFYGQNGKWLTVVSIAFTVIWLIAQRRQGRGELQTISEIERELTEAERTERERSEAGPEDRADPQAD